VTSPSAREESGCPGAPLFVLTHSVPSEVPAGDPPYTFVTDGIAEAVARARAAAGGKDVSIMGSAGVQQALQEGLLDELILHLVPVLLGGGVRLLDNVEGTLPQPEGVPGRHVEGENAASRDAGAREPDRVLKQALSRRPDRWAIRCRARPRTCCTCRRRLSGPRRGSPGWLRPSRATATCPARARSCHPRFVLPAGGEPCRGVT